jgi:hypothetical protein
MGKTIIPTYRYECDWALGCRSVLTLHGCTSELEATARARRDGWTVSKITRGPRVGVEEIRCPMHAYQRVEKPNGRPPRAVSRETGLGPRV